VPAIAAPRHLRAIFRERQSAFPLGFHPGTGSRIFPVPRDRPRQVQEQEQAFLDAGGSYGSPILKDDSEAADGKVVEASL
jgi:hypothetical protein